MISGSHGVRNVGEERRPDARAIFIFHQLYRPEKQAGHLVRSLHHAKQICQCTILRGAALASHAGHRNHARARCLTLNWVSRLATACSNGNGRSIDHLFVTLHHRSFPLLDRESQPSITRVPVLSRSSRSVLPATRRAPPHAAVDVVLSMRGGAAAEHGAGRADRGGSAKRQQRVCVKVCTFAPA